MEEYPYEYDWRRDDGGNKSSSNVTAPLMAAQRASPFIPIYVVTAFFGIIFVTGMFLPRKGVDSGIIRCTIMLSAFCMWLFWFIVYMAQMNPLIGPVLPLTAALWVRHSWGPIEEEP